LQVGYLGIKKFNDLPGITNFTFFGDFTILKVLGYSPYKPVFGGRKTSLPFGFWHPSGEPLLNLPPGSSLGSLAGRTSTGITLGLIIPKTYIPDGTGTGIPPIKTVRIMGQCRQIRQHFDTPAFSATVKCYTKV
jgi:hypothetical protein